MLSVSMPSEHAHAAGRLNCQNFLIIKNKKLFKKGLTFLLLYGILIIVKERRKENGTYKISEGMERT